MTSKQQTPCKSSCLTLVVGFDLQHAAGNVAVVQQSLQLSGRHGMPRLSLVEEDADRVVLSRVDALQEDAAHARAFLDRLEISLDLAVHGALEALHGPDLPRPVHELLGEDRVDHQGGGADSCQRQRHIGRADPNELVLLLRIAHMLQHVLGVDLHPDDRQRLFVNSAIRKHAPSVCNCQNAQCRHRNDEHDQCESSCGHIITRVSAAPQLPYQHHSQQRDD